MTSISKEWFELKEILSKNMEKAKSWDIDNKTLDLMLHMLENSRIVPHDNK